MKNFKTAQRLIAAIVALIILATPLLAQQRHNPARRANAVPEAPPTFDSLIAADSYKVYCEVRGVGGLVRSSAVNDLLDPVMKLGGPPKEFKTFVKWLDAHADALGGSRMMVAGWPSRPNLPTVVVAIEFSSPEEAKKFYPELRDFLPKLLPTPTPTPTPEPTPKPTPERTSAARPLAARQNSSEPQIARTDGVGVATAESMTNGREDQPTPSLPPYQMKQAGALVLISDIAFTFRSLRPRGSKALEDDQNFLLARNRFSAESLFLYIDLKAIQKEEEEQRRKWEEEAQKRAEAEAANPPKEAETVSETPDPEASPTPVTEEPVPPPDPSPEPSPEPASTEQPTVIAEPIEPDTATLSTTPQRGTDEVDPMFFSLYGALFGGGAKWPDAIGAALVFEGDAYVVRTLIINSEENKNIAIPFLPQLATGPAIVPESPNIFPADVDLFVSVSFDYQQFYDRMERTIADTEEMSRKYRRRSNEVAIDGPPPEAPFAALEKKLGLKIKDDLLPLLGNELALALPRKPKKPTSEPSPNPTEVKPATGAAPQQSANAGPNPIIAISVKDREAVARLIPKIIEGFGLKGANLLAQTEKRDGTELVSYAGVFSYAFVGDFLVVSPDAAAVRHVVDAYLEHQTLSSDSHFRNYTRWQPRQLLGQVYVAPGLIEELAFGAEGPGGTRREKLREFLSGVNPVIDPVTYSLTNDGLGPFHELRVPKNLLQVLVAGMSVSASETLPANNEAVAKSLVRTVANAEETFKATEGNDGYGTLDQLAAAGLLSRETLDQYGYRIEVSASKDKFEVSAVPLEYGRTGTQSYFVDETQVLRGGDHGGGAATVADQPVD
jgi:hypothetical protein